MNFSTTQKFKSICLRYNIYYSIEDLENIDHFMLRKVMLKAYECHKNINFETFVRKFYENPIEYLFKLSEEIEHDVIELHLLNNCFNDAHNKHFGCKYKNRWFFLTHSGNDFALPLSLVDFRIKNQDKVGLTYLVNYSNIQPNVIKQNVGTIRRNVLENYINKFL